MALTQSQITFIKYNMDIDQAINDPKMPPNLIADVISRDDFETEISNRIAKSRGLSFAFVYANVTNAFLGKYMDILEYAVPPGVFENVWKPAKACYPKVLIPDLSIVRR